MPKQKSYSKKRKFSKPSNGKANVKSKFSRYEEDFDKEGTNDPSWYAQYPELMQDAASIPYSIPTGTEISWDLDIDPGNPITENASYVYYNPHQAIPGIMTLGIVPAIGIGLDATSPVNVAADMLYTKVRAENSGARNYDSPDLMLYCLGMDQVYSLLTWYNRIYGVLMCYSQVNRYLPDALLKAQWVNFSDLILHINDFKAFLDTATAQAAAFSVPSDMTLFNRHAFMYQNIYKDADTAKGQLYQFAPRVFYYYDEYNGAGRLMPIDLITNYPNGMDFADLVDLFHRLMNPIISSEDFNIMSGDILKSFGPNGLIKLGLMPQGYTVVPIVDYEVLTQIKNATMSNIGSLMTVTISGDPDNWSIHQDANNDFLVYNPYLTVGATATHSFSKDRILSTYKTTPTPADNMVYSRLMWTMHEEYNPDDSKYYTRFDSIGSEFVVQVAVTTFHHDSNGVWKYVDTLINTVSENALTGLTLSNAIRMWLARHFDFSPCIYMFVVSGSTYFWPWFDTDNWTIVHQYELEKMHRTALMSMLRVPMIGSALPVSRK